MPFYVSCLTMLLDALHIDRIDCYGHHFGAQLVCELAIHAPQRVGRLVLDGLGLFSAEERALFRDRYAPVLEADADGRHLDWLWAFLSNTTIRFPHYSDRPEDGMPGGAALPPPLLTDIFAGVARNWRTYHFSYRVGFEQDVADRLPQIRHKALILAVAGDPLARYAVLAAALMPNVRVAEIDRAGRADAILSMIDDAP
jgi:pimeloyl-ACP methyl ester carboxylesterase